VDYRRGWSISAGNLCPVGTIPEPLAQLIREHRLIEAAVAEAKLRLTAATTDTLDSSLVDTAVEQLWLLQLLLEDDVERHIAKEERVLFPALRTQLQQLATLVDDMVAEHEDIKAQRNRVGAALATLDADHNAVRDAVRTISHGMEQLQTGRDISALAAMQETLERLDWLLQGHFTGEEDGLFLPAEALLSPATLVELTSQMAALSSEPAK
jgi:hemerythrin-like domain-containing protein